MKTGKAAGCIVIAGLIFVFAFGLAHAAPIVALDLVDGPPLFIGGTFEVQVTADVGSLEIVAFGFDMVDTDPSLTFNDASVAPQFKTTSSFFEYTDVAGIRNPLGGVVTGNEILLASLFFTANRPGSFTVGIFSDLSDLNEGLFFPHATPKLDMSTTIDINITAVPVPPALLLLSSGLATLIFIRRRICNEIGSDQGERMIIKVG